MKKIKLPFNFQIDILIPGRVIQIDSIMTSRAVFCRAALLLASALLVTLAHTSNAGGGGVHHDHHVRKKTRTEEEKKNYLDCACFRFCLSVGAPCFCGNDEIDPARSGWLPRNHISQP